MGRWNREVEKRGGEVEQSGVKVEQRGGNGGAERWESGAERWSREGDAQLSRNDQTGLRLTLELSSF